MSSEDFTVIDLSQRAAGASFPFIYKKLIYLAPALMVDGNTVMNLDSLPVTANRWNIDMRQWVSFASFICGAIELAQSTGT